MFKVELFEVDIDEVKVYVGDFPGEWKRLNI